MSRIGTNTGHGHVWARPDGIKARCGGPNMCSECALDFAEVHNKPTPTPAPAPMTARLRELMEKATPGPICESALVPLYAVQDYGDNEAVAAFAEFDDEGESTMQFQGEKAKANLALYTFLVNNAPTIIRLLEAVEGAEGALEKLSKMVLVGADEYEQVKARAANDKLPGKPAMQVFVVFEQYEEAMEAARTTLATLRAAREGAR